MATLARATLFLGAGPRTAERDCLPLTIEGPHRAKVIGNGLRELDRFLNLLIDEVAALIMPPGIDHARFARQRNSANKLRGVRAAMALPSPDHEPLRAVGRSRDCLFHCAGKVRRDHPCIFGMTVAEGWLIVTPHNLERICYFYEQIAADLIAAFEKFSFRFTTYSTVPCVTAGKVTLIPERENDFWVQEVGGCWGRAGLAARARRLL